MYVQIGIKQPQADRKPHSNAILYKIIIQHQSTEELLVDSHLVCAFIPIVFNSFIYLYIV